MMCVEDAERKERHLIERVHSDLQKIEYGKSQGFWKELSHSERWYRERFNKYELVDKKISAKVAEIHQERKVQSIVVDLVCGLIFGAIFGLAGGLVFCFVYYLVFGEVLGLVLGLPLALAFGSAGGLVSWIGLILRLMHV